MDGTTNFAHGIPHFCVSLGLEHRPAGLKADEDGQLVAAVIYDPLLDEMFTAESGRGAWLNSRPIRVSRVPELAGSLVATARSSPAVDSTARASSGAVETQCLSVAMLAGDQIGCVWLGVAAAQQASASKTAKGRRVMAGLFLSI